MRLNAGGEGGLCNPRVGRRFRRLLPCVVEMEGDGGVCGKSMVRLRARWLGSRVERST